MCTKSPFPPLEFPLRTNIDIDDELMTQAMAVTGLPTTKATVEEGLRLLLRIDEQKKALVELRGMGWEGDLDAMREGRTFAPET
jgi:Arc/MetJ family transcription regulator